MGEFLRVRVLTPNKPQLVFTNENKLRKLAILRLTLLTVLTNDEDGNGSGEGNESFLDVREAVYNRETTGNGRGLASFRINLNFCIEIGTVNSPTNFIELRILMHRVCALKNSTWLMKIVD